MNEQGEAEAQSEEQQEAWNPICCRWSPEVDIYKILSFISIFAIRDNREMDKGRGRWESGREGRDRAGWMASESRQGKRGRGCTALGLAHRSP